MSDNEPRLGRDYARPASDEAVDLQRYADAFRRDWRLVALMVFVVTALTLAISFAVHDQYRSSAKIVLEEVGGVVESRDVGRLQRELATLQALVETPRVLQRAARSQALSADELEDKVTTSVDRDANIITVAASDEQPAAAAAAANAVAAAFINIRADGERTRLVRARASLQRELDRLRAAGGTSSQTEALRANISELGVLIAGAGSELQIAENARPAKAAYAPRPLRNAVIALFAALLVAVLVVLGRDQFRPRMSSARELGRLLEIPILARIPLVRGRDRKTAMLTGGEYDAYQTLQASLRHHAKSKHVVLVTSAVPGEGKTSVSAGLGVALAQSGSSTLLISADLHSPALHEIFGVAPDQGFGEILTRLAQPDRLARDESRTQLRSSIVESAKPLRSNLFLIASAWRHRNAVRLLSADALGPFFEEVAELEYDYVIVDTPPLLGLPDSRVLATYADSILVVGRPDRLAPEVAWDMRDALDTLDTRVLGLVVVGAKADYAAYYGDRAAYTELERV